VRAHNYNSYASVKSSCISTEIDGVDQPWKFSNMKFTQSQVEQALELKHTKAQEDRNLFHPDKLYKYPKIAAWLDDPNGEYAEKFVDMSLKAFIAYKASCDNRSDQLKKMAKVTKKKARVAESEDESEDEHVREKKKKKGKSHPVDSDDLDE
jgi:hypothetical protein